MSTITAAMGSILTDPDAPHRPSEPHSEFETALMRAALDDTADPENRGTALRDLIPDVHPEMPHRMGGLSPEIKAAVERITGREVVGPNPHPRLGPYPPNPAGARASLNRWAVRWHTYLAS